MPLGARVWTAGKVLVFAGGLALTFAVFAIGSMQLALKAREVRVPDFRNRAVPEATGLAGDAGLSVRIDESHRADPKIPAGRIVAQDPEPGSVARRQRSVRVWLSTGPRTIVAPRLVGETERTAQLRLTQGGFRLSGVIEVRNDDYPADVVIGQDPPARSAAEQVALLVSRRGDGDRLVMPDLIALNGDRAADVLRRRGFRVSVTGGAPYPGVPPGTVLRQTPQAGYQVGVDEPVSLEVTR